MKLKLHAFGCNTHSISKNVFKVQKKLTGFNDDGSSLYNVKIDSKV